MSYPAGPPPDASKQAVAVASALTFAVRTRKFYSPEHPAVNLAVERIISVATQATEFGPLVIGVTPQMLIVDGVPVENTAQVVECARMLHDADIVELSLVLRPSPNAALKFLTTLTLDHAERRARGGPAAIWQAEGEPSFVIEQIDYQELLEREDVEGVERRDQLWTSIVRSVVERRRTFSENEQKRLLEISRDARTIGALADACRSEYCAPDGSPLLTTQAAAVASVFRQINAAVNVLEPDRSPDVLGQLVVATSSLEPALAMEVLRTNDAPDDPQRLMSALRQSFDERQVARLVARALTGAGTITSRLSQMLDTMAPSPARRQEVLRIADTLLAERAFTSQVPVSELRKSLEELVERYNAAEKRPEPPRVTKPADSPVAEPDQPALPPEIAQWLATLAPETVREQSAQLLIDLLSLETRLQRGAEIAQDMTAFAQESIMAGDYPDAIRIVTALTAASARPQSAREACAAAIDSIGNAPVMRDAMAGLAELAMPDFVALTDLCIAIGPAAVPAVVTGLTKPEGATQSERALKILIGLGPPAIPAIGDNIDEQPWWVQRDLAKVLGRIGTPMSVTPLQNLLRKGDARVLTAVVPALSSINDPAASRALGTVLRAASGEARMMIVASLVEARDSRVVPMLARILEEGDPFGRDFDLVLQTLDTVSAFIDDRAIKSIANLARLQRWFAPRRSRQLRQRAVDTLVKIGTPSAKASLDGLIKTGDRQLRKMATVARNPELQR